jgi:hypothetical protein
MGQRLASSITRPDLVVAVGLRRWELGVPLSIAGGVRADLQARLTPTSVREDPDGHP